MTLATRTILILTLILPIVSSALAQETATAPAATTTTESPETPAQTATATDAGGRANYELRGQFTRILQEHAWELAMLVKLDPSLLSNEQFMAKYPDVAQFLQANPEILRNPRFYLAEFPMPGERNRSAMEELGEMIAILGGFSLASFAFIWFIRAIIEQRRWNRLTRTQTEVHNKILDRFASSDELLQYIKTPAGSKFLESAPIPLYSEKPVRQNPSMTRVIWSIQIGMIVAAGALGMLLVSLRFGGESGQGFFALGAIAFCVGLGFIGSAIVSMILSRRLGAFPGDSNTPPAFDDTGLVR